MTVKDDLVVISCNDLVTLAETVVTTSTSVTTWAGVNAAHAL